MGRFLSLKNVSSDSSFEIKPRVLRYGTHFVQLTVTCLKPEVRAFDYGFIKILPSPLRANIIGGSYRKVAFEANIAFNASLSWDPDVTNGPSG